jgi:hypothetical protein
MDAGIDYHTVESAVVIACSEIVVAQPRRPRLSLPGEFDEVDIAVLNWIAAEGRSVSHRLLRM